MRSVQNEGHTGENGIVSPTRNALQIFFRIFKVRSVSKRFQAYSKGEDTQCQEHDKEEIRVRVQ